MIEVPITFSNGQTRYLKLKELEYNESSGDNESSFYKSILSVDKKNILSKDSEKKESLCSGFNSVSEQLKKRRQRLSKRSSVEGTLFVDKYRASRFHELISDAKANRLALSWVNKWKDAVFGKKSVKSQLYKKTNDDKRPLKKILLINGPPGTGKTTLAHVVAVQAGYNPVEVNASNERTSELLLSRMSNSFYNHKILLKEGKLAKRPELLILDECDGLDRGFVQELLKILNEQSKNYKITRPMIFISNDYYKCRELKKLGKYLEIVNIYKPKDKTSTAAVSLVNRLEKIAMREALIENEELSSISITKTNPCFQYLAEYFEYDFRLCLTGLQVLQQRSFKNIDFKISLKSIASVLSNMNKSEKGAYFSTMNKIQNNKNITVNNFQNQDFQLLLFGLSCNILDICRVDSLLYDISRYTNELSFLLGGFFNIDKGYLDIFEFFFYQTFLCASGKRLMFPSTLISLNIVVNKQPGNYLEESLYTRLKLEKSCHGADIGKKINMIVEVKPKRAPKKRGRDYFQFKKRKKPASAAVTVASK